jgi:hypothetical protein
MNDVPNAKCCFCHKPLSLPPEAFAGLTRRTSEAFVKDKDPLETIRFVCSECDDAAGVLKSKYEH